MIYLSDVRNHSVAVHPSRNHSVAIYSSYAPANGTGILYSGNRHQLFRTPPHMVNPVVYVPSDSHGHYEMGDRHYTLERPLLLYEYSISTVCNRNDIPNCSFYVQRARCDRHRFFLCRTLGCFGTYVSHVCHLLIHVLLPRGKTHDTYDVRS